MKSNVDAAAIPVARSRTGDYVALAKPRLNLLVVVSALAGYAMAGGEMSNAIRLIATVVGTALVAGGASAFNQIIEREPDALMRRTRLRPLPDGRLQARRGAAVCDGPLARRRRHPVAPAPTCSAPLVALATLLIYAVVYTPLKQRTSFSTVIGAIPGALPPVIGWAAARDSLSQGAWVLFGIVFLWQLPALPRDRLDVPRGLRARRLPDAAGHRAGRPEHRPAVRHLQRGAAAAEPRADADRDDGSAVLRRQRWC